MKRPFQPWIGPSESALCAKSALGYNAPSANDREAKARLMNIHFHRLQSGVAVPDAAALEQFQKQWATYQKLVDADALSHIEVGKILHDTLKAIPEPFAFLDIACGDAGQMSRRSPTPRLITTMASICPSPRSSWPQKNLKGLPFAVELDHRDFVAALERRRPEPADAAGAVFPSITSRPTESSNYSRPSVGPPAPC